MKPIYSFVTIASLGLSALALADCSSSTASSTNSVDASSPILGDAAGESGASDAGDAGPFGTCNGHLPKGSVCDPVSASGCDSDAGETCDYLNTNSTFQCFPGASAICAFCDDNNIFCGVGATCDVIRHQCVRYCCVDSDCKTGKCQFNILGDPKASTVGACEDEATAMCPAPQDAGADAK